MTAGTLLDLECTTCGGTTAHESVPCAEGHGTDCPEVVCTGCGEVAVVGVVVDETPARSGRLAGAA